MWILTAADRLVNLDELFDIFEEGAPPRLIGRVSGLNGAVPIAEGADVTRARREIVMGLMRRYAIVDLHPGGTQSA